MNYTINNIILFYYYLLEILNLYNSLNCLCINIIYKYKSILRKIEFDYQILVFVLDKNLSRFFSPINIKEILSELFYYMD